MSHLLEEIKQQDETAAGVLEKAGLCTDSDIQVLTREDLQDLFPGPENFKVRKTIFDIIHKQKPVEQHPPGSFRAIDWTIHLFTSATKAPLQAWHMGKSALFKSFTSSIADSLPGTSTSDTRGETELMTGQTDVYPQGTQSTGSSATDGPSESHNGQTDGGPQGAPAKLMYRMVVSGKTFDAHVKVMEKVKDQLRNQIQLVENDQDHNITFVFCPICSRVASDVDAAMTDVKDDKPVILVLMHHKREARFTSSVKTWRDDNKVLLFVHVFYHETIHGLLKCEQNDAAVSEIRNKLLTLFPRN